MTEQILDIITSEYYEYVRNLGVKPVLTADDIRKIAYSADGAHDLDIGWNARVAVWNAHTEGSTDFSIQEA